MRIAHFPIAVILALLVGWATPVLAAKGGSLAPGGNTIAGPGTTSLAVDAQEIVFNDSDSASDICVTVSNSGKSEVTFTITGDATLATVVASSATRAACVKNVSTVVLECAGTSSCSAEWRVDDN